MVFRVTCLPLLLMFLSEVKAWGLQNNHPQSSSSSSDLMNSCRREMIPRRQVMQSLVGLVASSSVLLLLPSVSEARDELFRPNLLTNPVLEQIRIWEQAEADELRYGGELAPGDAGNRGKIQAYTKLLVPILQMDQELAQINVWIDDRSQWTRALTLLLADNKYNKVAFKKMFNAYSDNIYYSDPDRANLYLAGGASPRSEQSLAYLLRNDILTNVEALTAELCYLVQDSTSEDDKNDTADLHLFAKNAVDSMQQYLELVPPNQLNEARELLRNN